MILEKSFLVILERKGEGSKKNCFVYQLSAVQGITCVYKTEDITELCGKCIYKLSQ